MLQNIAALSKALLTPLVAIIATYIAWQQWKTNRMRLNLERYDRRLSVYKEVKRILSIIARDADVSTEELLKFRTSVSEADFLFGREIPQYIEEIYRHGLSLWKWNQQYQDHTKARQTGSRSPAAEGYDHGSVVEGKDQELKWLLQQFEVAQKRFRKYLDISR